MASTVPIRRVLGSSSGDSMTEDAREDSMSSGILMAGAVRDMCASNGKRSGEPMDERLSSEVRDKTMLGSAGASSGRSPRIPPKRLPHIGEAVSPLSSESLANSSSRSSSMSSLSCRASVVSPLAVRFELRSNVMCPLAERECVAGGTLSSDGVLARSGGW